MNKICSCCGEEKGISLFQTRKASKDGLTAACKACLSARDKARANDPNRVKARQEYANTEAGREAQRRAALAYVARNPEKVRASKDQWQISNPKKRKIHGLVAYAVKTGVIKRQPCEACGRLPADAHHDDYDQPLAVRWLCPQHHREWHAEHGEAANAE